jgi:hypothetical protein
LQSGIESCCSLNVNELIALYWLANTLSLVQASATMVQAYHERRTESAPLLSTSVDNKMSDDRDCEIAAFAVNARQMPVRRGRVQFKIRVFETMDCALPTLETADFINISSLRGTI